MCSCVCACFFFCLINLIRRFIIEMFEIIRSIIAVMRDNRRKVDRAMRILGTDGASGECRIGQKSSGASSECRGTVGRKSDPGASILRDPFSPQCRRTVQNLLQAKWINIFHISIVYKYFVLF